MNRKLEMEGKNQKIKDASTEISNLKGMEIKIGK